MQVNPYLTFDGDCEQAFRAYKTILGGEMVAMIPHEGTPAADHVPAERRKKIIHARLVGNGMLLMGSDAPPDRYEPMKGFSVTLNVNEPAEAERVSTHWPTAARCACRSARCSGRKSSAC